MSRLMKRPAAAAAVDVTPRRRLRTKVSEASSGFASPGPKSPVLRRRLCCKQTPRRRYTTKRPPREEEQAPAAKRARGEDFLPPLSADVSVPFRRVVYLMRGPPGCGKSTAARSLLEQHLASQAVSWRPGPGAGFSPICRAFIHSTDDYFTHVDEVGKAEYKFNPKQIGDFHKRNQARCSAAMELGLTPLFVDNTNIALWEMRDYVRMADHFGYAVRIVDPRDLSRGALDPEVLQQRCSADAGDRAVGKAIGFSVLERMARNFEELPGGSDASAVLEAIRCAKAPWELREKLPLYAGLDVEAKALAALGAVELGPHFWGAHGSEESAPCGEHYVDARYRQNSGWTLPDRLHVTVQFFGFRPDKRDMVDAQALVGTWHEVTAHALVFVRGGGLLCAACRIVGESADRLRGLAPDGWWPHITLLTSKPWRPVDSTAVLRGWDAALEAVQAAAAADGAAAADAEPAGTPTLADTQLESSMATSMDDTVREAGEAASGEAAVGEAAVGGAAVASEATADNAAPGSAAAGEGKAPEEVLSHVSSILKGALEDGRLDQVLEAVGDSKAAPEAAAAGTAADASSVAAAPGAPAAAEHVNGKAPTPRRPQAEFDGHCHVFRDAPVMDRLVDLCVIPLDPPRSLGRCQFQLFFA